MKTRLAGPLQRLALGIAIGMALLWMAAAPASASGMDLRRDGNRWVTVDPDGTIRNSSGSRIGSFERDGTIRNVSGSRIGTVERDGTIRNGSGSRIGTIERDGTLRNSSGSRVGSVESDGTIRQNGNRWGSAQPCVGFEGRRVVAAALMFFSGFFQP